METHLVDEVDQCTNTSRHERGHHPLVFMSGSQVAFDKEYYGQRQSSACHIILPIFLVEYKPYELHRKPDPEKDVEFDQAFKDLVACVHLFDLPVGSQELVHLPTELCVDFVSQTNVSELGDGDDNGEDGREHIDGEM